MAFVLRERARPAHTITGIHKTLIIAWGAVALSATLIGCGGGSNATSSSPSATDSGGGRVTAQAVIAVSSDRVTGPGWVVAPPTFVEPTNYVPSTHAGATYYVDADAGYDGNDGLTEQSPWKTLAHVATKVFSEGDAILLRCGKVWRETLTLSGANRSNYKNLLVGAYGSNCDNTNRPVIRGSRWVNDVGWTPMYSGSPVKKLSVAGPVERLFKHGQPQTKARYPNPQSNGDRFASADVTSTLTGSETDSEAIDIKRQHFKARATDMTVLNNKDVVGATIYVRTLPFVVETATVAEFDATTGEIKLDHKLKFPIEKSAGYILEGKLWMLNSDGEWFFDGNNPGYLYYQGTGGDTTGLEASYIPRGVNAYAIDGLKIEHIRLEQQTEASIIADSITNLVVNRVESVHSGGSGIDTLSAPNAIVSNSRVDGAGLFGISVNLSTGASVSSNYVTRSGIFRIGAPYERNIQNSGGIRVANSEDAHIEGNYVYNTASLGIHFDNRSGVVVAHNTVLLPCQLLTDCGGIYTHGGPNLVPDTAIRATVHHNIVAGLTSNVDGNFVVGSGNTRSGLNQAVGIYLDDHSSWVEVSNNTVVGAEVGLFIHNSADNLIQNNTVRAVTHTSFLASFDEKPPVADLMTGNKVLNNTFFSLRRIDPAKLALSPITDIAGEQTYAQLWLHRDDALAFFANTGSGPRNRSEGNTTYTLSKVEAPSVWRMGPGGAKLEQASGAVWGIKSASQAIESQGLGQWLALTQPPSNAKDQEQSPVAFKPLKFTEQTSLILNGDFSNGVGDWTANGASWTPETGAACGGAANCGKATATQNWHIVASSSFSVATNGLYRAAYTVAAGNAAGAHNAHIRLNAAPWSSVGHHVPTMAFAANEVRRIEHFFKTPNSASNVVLSLRPTNGTDVTGASMYFSQASLSPVSIDQALPALSGLGVILVNASSTSQSFGCTTIGFTSTDCQNQRVVNELNSSVTTYPHAVPARSSEQLYARLVDWVQ